jgi:hypothetical protein
MGASAWSSQLCMNRTGRVTAIVYLKKHVLLWPNSLPIAKTGNTFLSERH